MDSLRRRNPRGLNFQADPAPRTAVHPIEFIAYVNSDCRIVESSVPLLGMRDLTKSYGIEEDRQTTTQGRNGWTRRRREG